MTSIQAKHLRTLIAEQVDAERFHALLQALNDIKSDVAGAERTLAARRVTEYIDLLTKDPNMTPAQRLKLDTLIAEHTEHVLLAHNTSPGILRSRRLAKANNAAQALRTCLDELTDKPDLRRHGDAKETWQ